MSALKFFSAFRVGLVALIASTLAGCGGGGGGGGGGNAVGGGGSSLVTANAANGTAANPLAAFTAISGIPLVTVSSPPQVNFTAIYKDGHVVQGLTAAGITVTDPETNAPVVCNNVRFAIAKLVRDPLGNNPDQWVNYVYVTEAGTPGLGPGGVVQHPNAKQASTDNLTGANLTFHNEGYYTYRFSTDIRNPAFDSDGHSTNGVVFEPGLTHRVAIEMCFVDIDGTIVRANPYYDFTLVDDGAGGWQSVTVTDPAQTRKVSDASSCNECHRHLAKHGGARAEPQFCVMCHNAGTTDANSGEVLDFRTVVHRIHAGRRLSSATGGASVAYRLWSYNDVARDFSDVGFPQDLRNCTKCHDGAKTNSAGALLTPQGDNWKTKPSKEACLTCHKTDATSPWYASHITTFGFASLNAMGNGTCRGCHSAGGGLNVGAERVHWNQNEEDSAFYKVNIESATYDNATRGITLKYSVTDPTNGNAAYDLRADCAGPCTTDKRFGNLFFQVGYLNLVGAPSALGDYSSFNNGGSGANAHAYTGVDDGTHHYTVTITLPPDKPTEQAHGTARVVSIGQVREVELDPRSRMPVVPAALLNVSAQHSFKDVSLDGTLTPRRTIVDDENCKKCHGLLGTTIGSNTLSNAFHSGSRDSVMQCPICHDANLTVANLMLDGSGFNESFQLKRLIHGIHGGAKRQFDLFHNADDLTVKVQFPGIISDCTTCHFVDPVTGVGAFENDRGVLGAVVQKPPGVTDPLGWLVFSPKAASCTACHDSLSVRDHMRILGGATFGTMTQGDILAGNVTETCDACHGLSTGIARVRDVHNVPIQAAP